MTQLNDLCDRQAPFAIGSPRRLRGPDDPQIDLPRFEQARTVLILQKLAACDAKVHVRSFGACGTIAAALNRDPNLLRRKVACVHLSAGTSGACREWNVNHEDVPDAALYLHASYAGPTRCLRARTMG